MEVGESTVRIGEHPAIGPVRIEIGQTMVQRKVAPISYTDQLLVKLVADAEHIDGLLTLIFKHLTRPPWYTRLWRRICGIL
jgi:hypothetical protein